MKVVHLVLLFLLGTFFSFSAFAHTPQGTTVIHSTNTGFDPQTITVPYGTTISFENTTQDDIWPASNDHPTHELYTDFDPQLPVSPGKTWEFVALRPGTWEYHDHLHPLVRGTLIVTDAENTELPKQKPSFLQKIVIFLQQLFSREISTQVETKLFTPPQTVSTEQLSASYNEDCSTTDFNCIVSSLKTLTETAGPKPVLELTRMLQQLGKISSSVDDHQLAHQIGRHTALVFGTGSDSFFLCDTEFNYGCQHGFFEYVLGKTDSVKAAIDQVCGTISDEYPTKFKFYCYHGAGHGVMMAKGNDVIKSLSFCDELAPGDPQVGCWQGVLMENANAGTRGEARSGVFSDTDPLAPCNQIHEKYQYQCFINHAGWLMKFFQNNLAAAAQSCLQAPTAHIRTCLQSLGLMVTNPSWQPKFVPRQLGNDVISIAKNACQRFPKNYLSECVIGAVDNLLNFDQLDISRPAQFCAIVDTQFQNLCYTKIGSSLKQQTTSINTVREICEQLTTTAQTSCLHGANL